MANRLQVPHRVSVPASLLSYKLVHYDTGDKFDPLHINDLKHLCDRSEDLDISQIPVTARPSSRSVMSSPMHGYNLQPRR